MSVTLGKYVIGQEVRETKKAYRRQGFVVDVNEASGRVRVSWTERENGSGEWHAFGRNLRTWVSPKTITHVVRAGSDPFPE